jgi:hypothetical protein
MSCRYIGDDGLPLYRDNGHLNVRGARFLRPYLAVALQDLMLLKKANKALTPATVNMLSQ